MQKRWTHRKHSQTIFFSLASGKMQMLFKMKQCLQTELTLGRCFLSPPALLRAKQSLSRRCPQRVLSSWAGDVVLEGAEEVLVSHKSVWALQLKSSKNPQENLSNTRKLGGWRKHKQKMSLKGHLKLSALKTVEADCVVVGLLPNG